jgi:hypothetical protein
MKTKDAYSGIEAFLAQKKPVWKSKEPRAPAWVSRVSFS